MVQHRLQPLLAPRSVAIVGASPKQESFGWTSYRALADCGFEGRIALVNPGYAEIDGRPCFASLSSIPGGAEHAMLNVANVRLEGIFVEAIAGSITLDNDDIVSAGGDILLKAAQDITLNNQVTSTGAGELRSSRGSRLASAFGPPVGAPVATSSGGRGVI